MLDQPRKRNRNNNKELKEELLDKDKSFSIIGSNNNKELKVKHVSVRVWIIYYGSNNNKELKEISWLKEFSAKLTLVITIKN